MKTLNEWFGLTTVRKKVLLLSKLAGGAIVLFYVFAAELPISQSAAFWVWFLLLVAVILGVDFLLGRFISAPLTQINRTAKRMASLDFSAQCTLNTQDEFGELSQNLNRMAASLQEALAQLEAANARLEQDVAQEHFLLEQRKELADSLSHEMKTPLGIIQAYAEGLKEEPDEKKRQAYLETILSATGRMNALLVSLLDLSALEAGAAPLALERFDFIELTETVAGRLLLDVPGAAFTLTYELPNEKVFVYADPGRLEQVLNNLLLNAKRHVRRGGNLHLAVVCCQNSLRFSIFNEGELIPEQELPLIWRKFYRGERPQTGGSGLGLAIVAQVLALHKASCGVQNKPGGVEFYFDLATTE